MIEVENIPTLGLAEGSSVDSDCLRKPSLTADGFHTRELPS